MMENNIIPLAKVIPIKELKGWLGKGLVVPPQRLGVVLEAGKPVATFAPGSHNLVSPWERLAGKAVGMAVGFIPAEPVSVQAQDAYLLSGDGILVDLNLTATTQIADPGRFFSEVVIPRGETSQAVFDLSDERVHAILASLVRQYAASDLVRGLPSARLAGDLQAALNPLLLNQGLAIQSVDLLLFWKSEDKVAAQEKIQELAERLQDLEIQKKMALIENQAQLDDFVQQLQPESGVEVGFRPVQPVVPQAAVILQPQPAAEAVAVSGPPLPGLAEAAKPLEKAPAYQPSLGSIFFQGLSRQKAAADSKRHWRLEGLFKGQKHSATESKSSTATPLRSLIGAQSFYIGGLLVVGAGATGLAIWLADQHGKYWDNLLLTLLVPVWFLIIKGILDSLKRITERREEISQALQPGAAHLVDLSQRDPQQTDRLVRQQCGAELAHSRDTLTDIRSRVFKSGQVDLALALRDLEWKFDLSRAKTLDAQSGTPPYLDATLHINRQAWGAMLAYEEGLLGAANSVNEKAALLQQKAPEGVNPRGLKDLESSLDVFMHLFIARSRTLQTNSK